MHKEGGVLKVTTVYMIKKCKIRLAEPLQYTMCQGIRRIEQRDARARRALKDKQKQMKERA